MPVCLLHPRNLERLNDLPDKSEVRLEVTDHRDRYDTRDGDGAWIRAFLEFIETKVHERCPAGRAGTGSGGHPARFYFSDTDRLEEDVLGEIPGAYLRALCIDFANRHYEAYRDDDVTVPDYDEIRYDCQEYCGECEVGWTEEYGEYDGPLAEDVEDEEDEDEPDITSEERQARQERNRERRAERERREVAREEAESEVIGREFTCDEDCDSFLDYVCERFIENLDTNSEAIEERWGEFLEERGETLMPGFPLQTGLLSADAVRD